MNVRSVVAFLFALLTPSISASAQSLPKIEDVTSIVIHTTFGGLGASSGYRETIGHGDGAFIRTDGTLVRDHAVQELLDALKAPASTLTPSSFGFDRGLLGGYLDNAEAYIGPAVSLPVARHTFEAMFFDSAAMEQWFIRASYPEQLPRPKSKPGTFSISEVSVSDFYPAVSVSIHAPGHDITLSSSSQRPFMLPIVVSGAISRDAWDPRLARAIAGIMPGGALLRDYLTASSAPYEWADAIANGRAVSLAIQSTAIDAATAARVAKLAGFTIAYNVTKNPVSLPEFGENATTLGGVVAYVSDLRSAAGWTGWVSQLDLPQVHYTMGGVRSSVLALHMLLEPASDAFTSIRMASWLVAALAKAPTARVTIDHTDASTYVTELKNHGKHREAELLDFQKQSAVQLTIVGDSSSGSRWLLLKNGDAILLDYQRGVTFPFGAEWFAALPRKDGDDFIGVLVHPDGTVGD